MPFTPPAWPIKGAEATASRFEQAFNQLESSEPQKAVSILGGLFAGKSMWSLNSLDIDPTCPRKGCSLCAIDSPTTERQPSGPWLRSTDGVHLREFLPQAAELMEAYRSRTWWNAESPDAG